MKALIGLCIGVACLTAGAAWSIIWPAFRAVHDSAAVDTEWYLSQYPDVRAAIQDGRFRSALDHYRAFGYFEKRFPSKPVLDVDEAWYLRTYPDVAQAIREGREMSAYNHFIMYGYREGREPRPIPIKQLSRPGIDWGNSGPAPTIKPR